MHDVIALAVAGAGFAVAAGFVLLCDYLARAR